MPQFLYCKSTKDKAICLFFAAFASILFAIVVNLVLFALYGPTTAGTWYNKYWSFFFAAICFTLLSFYIFRNDFQEHPERPFFVIVLVFTCMASIAFDICEISWDVGNHFRFMLSWTEPDLGLIADEAEAAEMHTAFGGPYAIADLNYWKNWLNDMSNLTSNAIVSDTYVHFYNKISSLPASFVYFLCTALGTSFTTKYVLAKLLYAIIYSVVVFLGMRCLHSGKMIFAAIALMPISLFLAANYSYDYWVNAFLLYAMALLIRELQTPDTPLTLKRAVYIFLIFIVGCGPKAIYFPLAFLCILMPRTKFSNSFNSRIYRAFCFIVPMLIASTFMLSFITTGSEVGDSRGGSDVSSIGQVAHILQDPIGFAQILITFLINDLLRSPMSIDHFAYLQHPMTPVWLISALLLLFTTFTDKNGYDIPATTWKSRTLTIIISFVTLCLVCSALYVSFTPVGLDTIYGVQHRYYIPLLFGFFYFLGSARIGKKIRTHFKHYNFIALLLLSILPYITIWECYLIYVI